MSLLGSQVFANPTTPIWLSTAGGVIDGSILATGNIDTEGVFISTGGTADQKAVMKWDTGNGTAVFGSFNSADPAGPYLPISFRQFNTAGDVPAMTITPTQSIGIGTTTPASLLDVSGTVTARKLVLPTAGGAATAGTASILAGQNNVIVQTSAVTANSIILTTRMGNAATGPGVGSGQQAIMVPSSAIVPGVSFNAFLVDASSGIQVASSVVNSQFSWVLFN
jgi:hypothetical protein